MVNLQQKTAIKQRNGEPTTENNNKTTENNNKTTEW